MHRVLSHKVLRQVSAMCGPSAGVAAADRPARLCCCVLLSPRLAASSPRWLSASAPNHSVQHPKQQPTEEKPLPPPPPAAPPVAPHAQEKAPHVAHTGEAGAADSAAVAPTAAEEEGPDVDPLQDKSIGLIQRFKKMFKQYGKVMIPVHLVTSSVWFGTFYYAAMKGANVGPFLEVIGLPDSIVRLLGDSSSGYALTAYAMYKIATPARYTLTLGTTSLSVKYLRRHGYFSTPPPVKEYIQDKMEETKERLTERIGETKEMFAERMEETKERLSEKMEETKDKISEKLQETKDKAFFRKKVD
ncbi:hypothetical protein NHX12_001048 [Muraenolepis orangiensis]|uniref:DUF1279 domain-containing protein n=1 Tax=Muraenolepis orangiensis TaxID=630683 RepID=A0A9Q0DYZ2_9TELE|nr:hypothetical protein NHX12_001048 [Muraenolepis orangiensis]